MMCNIHTCTSINKAIHIADVHNNITGILLLKYTYSYESMNFFFHCVTRFLYFYIYLKVFAESPVSVAVTKQNQNEKQFIV